MMLGHVISTTPCPWQSHSTSMPGLAARHVCSSERMSPHSRNRALVWLTVTNSLQAKLWLTVILVCFTWRYWIGYNVGGLSRLSQEWKNVLKSFSFQILGKQCVHIIGGGGGINPRLLRVKWYSQVFFLIQIQIRWDLCRMFTFCVASISSCTLHASPFPLLFYEFYCSR